MKSDYKKRMQSFCSKNRGVLLKKQTKAEVDFAAILDKHGIKYIPQKGFISKMNTFCLVDFYLPKPFKLAVEVDGGYHETKEQMEKDRVRDALLSSRGISVMRIKNEQVSESTVLSELAKFGVSV
jgi:very-short-patch-repair endonuclease